MDELTAGRRVQVLVLVRNCGVVSHLRQHFAVPCSFLIYKQERMCFFPNRMCSAPYDQKKETPLRVDSSEGVVSLLRCFRKGADETCRVGKWLSTAIIRARKKAVLGRYFEAHPRSLATAIKGTQVPATVTQLPSHGYYGGLVVTIAPLRRFEIL